MLKGKKFNAFALRVSCIVIIASLHRYGCFLASYKSQHCYQFLLNSLKDHGSLTKQEIVNLLWDILSDQLSDKQKENKIDNILRKLRAEQKIQNKTQGNKSTWSLVKA